MLVVILIANVSLRILYLNSPYFPLPIESCVYFHPISSFMWNVSRQSEDKRIVTVRVPFTKCEDCKVEFIFPKATLTRGKININSSSGFLFFFFKFYSTARQPPKGFPNYSGDLLEGCLNHPVVSTVLWLHVSDEVSVPGSYGRRRRAAAVTGATCSWRSLPWSPQRHLPRDKVEVWMLRLLFIFGPLEQRWHSVFFLGARKSHLPLRYMDPKRVQPCAPNSSWIFGETGHVLFTSCCTWRLCPSPELKHFWSILGSQAAASLKPGSSASILFPLVQGNHWPTCPPILQTHRSQGSVL